MTAPAHETLQDSERTPRDAGPCVTELDARGITPPDHLKAILSAFAALPSGQRQCVRTRLRPGSLLQALAGHGVAGETCELPDGSWRTTLRRSADAAAL